MTHISDHLGSQGQTYEGTESFGSWHRLLHGLCFILGLVQSRPSCWSHAFGPSETLFCGGTSGCSCPFVARSPVVLSTFPRRVSVSISKPLRPITNTEHLEASVPSVMFHLCLYLSLSGRICSGSRIPVPSTEARGGATGSLGSGHHKPPIALHHRRCGRKPASSLLNFSKLNPSLLWGLVPQADPGSGPWRHKAHFV